MARPPFGANLGGMARARRFTVLPWIGLILVLRLVSAPGPRAPREEPLLDAHSAAAATLCATLGCGCPHEEVRTECCCEPGDAFDAESRTSVARAPTLAAAGTRADDDALPCASLTAFHCSGPKPARSAAGAPSSPAVSWRLVASSGLARERDWSPRIEPGPPFDLATEPATPPPRMGARG